MDITDEKVCAVCRGVGSIIVRKGICMEPLEETQTCPGCGGRGRIRADPGRLLRFWRRRF